MCIFNDSTRLVTLVLLNQFYVKVRLSVSFRVCPQGVSDGVWSYFKLSEFNGVLLASSA